MNKKTVLVTGASGFIGKSLCRELNNLDCVNLVAIDRRHGFDLSKPGWSDNIDIDKVDVVYHLAQSKEYRSFPDGAYDMHMVNTTSTIELASWAKDHGVDKFIFTSTGNVYGEEKDLLSETDVCKPNSMYAISKHNAERILSQYSKYFQTTICRLFGVYGPGQKNMLIANLIDSIRYGKEIQLAQSKGLLLTPMYIADCVNALLDLCNVKMLKDFEVINFAGREILSIANIVDILSGHFLITPNIKRTDGNVGKLCANIDKMISLLPDLSLTSFETAVKRL